MSNIHKTEIQPAGIITKASGFVSSYDYTINPYAGCGFGCTYCYAQFFTHQHVPQDHEWGKWVAIKSNALTKLSEFCTQHGLDHLNQKSIYVSTVTDPYQPAEREARITRGIFQYFLTHCLQPKVVIQTRSPLVTRDIPIFQGMIANGARVQVNMTVTTDCEEIRKKFEPSCPSNRQRTQAVAELHQGGIPTCITLTPLLFLKDEPERFAHELMATGCRSFIVQPFHTSNRDKPMRAATGEKAEAVIAEHLGLDPQDPGNGFARRYQEHYQENLAKIQQVFQNENILLGKGRDGFRPPF